MPYRAKRTPAERFWPKVDKDGPVPEDRAELGPCWLWLASTRAHGYGQFYVNPSRGRVPAHRFAYELVHGPIPEGLNLCHRCDNPPCVNPAHLFPGTQHVNVIDMVAKGRASGGRTPRPGALSPNAKLTQEEVDELRALRRAGTSYRTLGPRFGISPSAACRIVNGKRWGAA